MPHPTIGLIGYGAFGRLITQHLASHCNFVIYDPAYEASSQSALDQDIIVFALPAQYLEAFLVEHAKQLLAASLYIDVCSVKIKPVEIMLRCLPTNAAIIATHPMFGPATAADSLRGLKIMTYPVRVEPTRYAGFLQFLGELELQIIETTPEEHDRAMAYVQGLSHYIGRVMQQMNIPQTTLATRAYEDLVDMKNIQGNDSDDLFRSIVALNPYTMDVLKRFEAARNEIDQRFKL